MTNNLDLEIFKGINNINNNNNIFNNMLCIGFLACMMIFTNVNFVQYFIDLWSMYYKYPAIIILITFISLIPTIYNRQRQHNERWIDDISSRRYNVVINGLKQIVIPSVNPISTPIANPIDLPIADPIA